jgi:hypothetical protein
LTQQNDFKKAFRPPGADEFNLASQRLLAFEEPVSVFAQLKKTVQRQLIKSTRENLRTESQTAFASLHRVIFAGAELCSAFLPSLIFSLALALEDFRVFRQAAFAAVTFDKLNDAADDDLCILHLADEIADLIALDRAKARWLALYLLATPDWARCTDQRVSAALSKINSHANVKKMTQSPAQLLTAALAEADVPTLFVVAQSVAEDLRGHFRPGTLVLVEGQSETIVLPHFARLLDEPFEVHGIHVVASGGAQQVTRRYLTLKEVLKIPIVCLFDGDASEAFIVIEDDMRDTDALIALESSELEDCYPYNQLLAILDAMLAESNQNLASDARGTLDIPRHGSRKAALNKIFRSRGLGDFDKLAFARSSVFVITRADDVPEEICRVIKRIAEINGHAE